ncbi:tRNA(Met) cytidine acetyltransferase TmcA [Halosimplex pelagicum]|uniref:tRNA(Met) cytidine acetyltransferase TmcA n=1 Tax=Halosimplex pelagicum TaxID=869886 RepID=A0A7D5TE03_9EURY|nr:tRNA(Met) cytidine acetyltransferase TmcA [Halosimplex pelagicum]QLH84229.1 tRNA(Met) cytidine acetyltransferase [Halosimplex pelagicum]
MPVDRVASALREEARATDERRLLVLAGEGDATREAAADALDAVDIDSRDVTYLGDSEGTPWERVQSARAGDLLGTTHGALVVDCHEACRPNALGRAVGAVDGGGLLVLCVPPLDSWPDRRDGFDETLAVPPFEVSEVAGNFRRRLVELLRAHPGIAVVDVGDGSVEPTVERDGLTDPAPRRPPDPPAVPDDPVFPAAVYERCRTDDQVSAVEALEALGDPGNAVVVEADRGRGKSSAAGLAAGALALAGRDVLVTAPGYPGAAEVFARAREVLVDAGSLASAPDESDPILLETARGRVRFEKPTAAAELPGDPDAVVVDEAAALPVRLLERFLDAPAAAFATTVHGYEGAGRGFSVRFRDRLDDGDFEVADVSMTDPIRYAAGDPVEVWAFRALLLDAGPAVDSLVEGADPADHGSIGYEAFEPEDLLADEHLLREVFGLLVAAHYRTEPSDLARLLDAPNVAVRALTHEGHVVSVALLAREGDLPADLRAHMYEGGRVRGNMIPDVLTSQLRDEAAGVPEGLRVLRIATHHAVRSRGLGSRLLSAIREEFADDADWLGTGYGATPELLRFWRANGFSTVHLSTTRNDASGEYSAVMLAPTSDAGRELADRHSRWLLDRVGAMLSDPLDDMDPDVVRAALRSVDAAPELGLSDWEWRLLVGTTGGAGIFDTSPRPLRRLTVRYLTDAGDETAGENADGEPSDPLLTPRQERLLVRKALQGRPWGAVAEELGFHSHGQCMRALGEATRPLVSRFGGPKVAAELERFE